MFEIGFILDFSFKSHLMHLNVSIIAFQQIIGPMKHFRRAVGKTAMSFFFAIWYWYVMKTTG